MASLGIQFPSRASTSVVRKTDIHCRQFAEGLSPVFEHFLAFVSCSSYTGEIKPPCVSPPHIPPKATFPRFFFPHFRPRARGRSESSLLDFGGKGRMFVLATLETPLSDRTFRRNTLPARSKVRRGNFERNSTGRSRWRVGRGDLCDACRSAFTLYSATDHRYINRKKCSAPLCVLRYVSAYSRDTWRHIFGEAADERERVGLHGIHERVIRG